MFSVSTWVAIVAVTALAGVIEGAYRRVRTLEAEIAEMEHALFHASNCKDGCAECRWLATEALGRAARGRDVRED